MEMEMKRHHTRAVCSNDKQRSANAASSKDHEHFTTLDERRSLDDDDFVRVRSIVNRTDDDPTRTRVLPPSSSPSPSSRTLMPHSSAELSTSQMRCSVVSFGFLIDTLHEYDIGSSG